jgi:formyltetrahydrofolate synthetase
MLSDLEITQSIEFKNILEIASSSGIDEKYVIPYGKHKGKIDLKILEDFKDKEDGKLICVTAITPTPLGEGKTVTTIGTSLGLNKIGKRVFTCIRQPSMGPIFGIKGGAAGGGYAQVGPMEDINLHLTGDIHAISAAHNLGAAALDSRLYHEERKGYEDFENRTGMKALKIDHSTITWKRVVDMNDRALRGMKIGMQSAGTKCNLNGVPRESAFDITVASELMAILALAVDLKDMRNRIGKIVMAHSIDGKPITAEDLKVAGAMTVVMRDAIQPTLMQTTEYTPCFVHAGPFANIAHGNSSIIADKIALKLADYVVTEAGFGADMGYEKFCDIKTRYSKKDPSAVVLVATLRSLKMHSGDFKIIPGKELVRGLVEENMEALQKGICNLKRHVEFVTSTGVPVVVAINKFATDSDKEVEYVKKMAKEFGAFDAVVSTVHPEGGEGGKELAEAIVKACEKESNFNFLYPNELSLKDKIEKIATEVYKAGKVVFQEKAIEQLSKLEAEGYGELPVCMAKTPLSISHDPNLKGAPEGFDFPVKEVHLSAGAEFVYVLAGTIQTMPGLGSKPSYMNIDIDENGEIIGLF